MTCIVGLNTGNKIIIAGDGMGSNGFTGFQEKKPKVFKKDNFIFGVCGDFRVMQILANKFSAPKRMIDQTTDDYIYNTFIDYIFTLFKDNNCLNLKDGKLEFQGSFLFGYEKELYQMFGNFQININSLGYDECGSGGYHAIASLYSTNGLDISPEDRVKKAIECANQFVISVDNKIDIVELVYNTDNNIRKIDNKRPKPNTVDTHGIQCKGIKR
jgi:ATP-dependent protease HslVU (ClpYQ) peptidase subunit